MSITDLSSKVYNIKGIMTIGTWLYLNEKMADFHFVFESDDGLCERIPAHKLLLAAASDVFNAMFNTSVDWLETKEANIVDASPAAFKEFLQFIYLDQAKVTTENVAQVINLGEKYDIAECVTSCKDFLMTTLTSETVCMGYEVAIIMDDEELLELCENKIIHSIKDVFSSSSFLNCNKKVLGHILHLKWISCTAAELIAAFISWVKSTSKQEQVTRAHIQEWLGTLFYYLPFGRLSLQEFAAFDRTYEGLLTYDEHREIMQMMASEEFKPKIFKSNRTTSFGISLKWDKVAVISCNRCLRLADAPYFVGNIETTTFSTNKAALFGGVVCTNLWMYRDCLYERVETLQTQITIVKITSNREVILYDGEAELSSSFESIYFSEPILITPGFVYRIQLEQQPPISCCTCRELKSEVKMENDITVKFYEPTEIASEGMRGLICMFKFNSI